MATIGRLVATISADTSDLKQGLNEATNATSRAASDITDQVKNIAGAFGAYLSADLFLGFVKGSIDAAAQIGKLSQQTGIAVESLSALNYAANLNGASIQDLDGALKGLANKMMEATTGSGEAADVFKALGISVADASGNLRSSESVLMDMADAFAGMEDGAGKAALSQKLMEDAGVALIPVLNQGSEGIKALGEEAASLGVILDKEAAAQAGAFNQNLTRLQATTTALGQTIGVALAPTLNQIAKEFLTALRGADDLKGGADTLRSALSGLYATGVGVATVFNMAGVSLGGAAAAITAALNGDFAQARSIMGMLGDDLDEVAQKAADSIRRVAEATGAPVVTPTAGATGGKRPAPVITPSGGDAGKKGDAAKAAADVMKQAAEVDAFFADVENAARQRDIDNLNKFLENLAIRGDARMLEGQTELERANAQYESEHARLLEALELEMITKQEFDALLIEAEAQKQATLTQLTADETAKRTALEQQAADAELQLKQRNTNAIINLLGMLGTKNKAFAVAAIALQTYTAFTQNKIATALAANLAFASQIIPGDPSSLARATAAYNGALALGAGTGAAIIAAGAIQAAGAFGGGSSGGLSAAGGIGSNLTNTPGSVAVTQAPTINQTITIRGINEGELFSGESVRTLIDSLIDAQRNGARIVLA